MYALVEPVDARMAAALASASVASDSLDRRGRSAVASTTACGASPFFSSAAVTLLAATSDTATVSDTAVSFADFTEHAVLRSAGSVTITTVVAATTRTRPARIAASVTSRSTVSVNGTDDSSARKSTMSAMAEVASAPMASAIDTGRGGQSGVCGTVWPSSMPTWVRDLRRHR